VLERCVQVEWEEGGGARGGRFFGGREGTSEGTSERRNGEVAMGAAGMQMRRTCTVQESYLGKARPKVL
jgi:hypothetical protein